MPSSKERVSVAINLLPALLVKLRDQTSDLKLKQQTNAKDIKTLLRLLMSPDWGVRWVQPDKAWVPAVGCIHFITLYRGSTPTCA